MCLPRHAPWLTLISNSTLNFNLIVHIMPVNPYFVIKIARVLYRKACDSCTIANKRARSDRFPHITDYKKPARKWSCQPSSVHCVVHALYLILCINAQFINATQEAPAAKGKTVDYTSHARPMHLFLGNVLGQCVASDELESMRYHLYSELSESKKEMDALRNDLQYWKNETLNILKIYLKKE